MVRREALKIMAAASGLFGRNTLNVHLGIQTNAWPIDPRDFANVLAVLAKIKGYGYEGFETGFANVQGQFDHAAEAKAKIEATGLRFFGVHIFLGKYDPDTHIASAELYE